MNELEWFYMRALGLVGVLLALRWPRLVIPVPVALVAFTAFGMWPAGMVLAVGWLGPALRRVRREGVSLGRRR